MKGLEAVHDMAPETLVLEAVWAAGVNGTGSVYEDGGTLRPLRQTCSA